MNIMSVFVLIIPFGNNADNFKQTNDNNITLIFIVIVNSNFKQR